MEKPKTQNRGIKGMLVAKDKTQKGEVRTAEKTRTSVNRKKKSTVMQASSPSTTSSSPSIVQTSKASVTKFLLKKKMDLVKVQGLNIQDITSLPPPAFKDLEIHLLQVECEELRNRLGCLREGLVGQKPSDVEDLMKQSQKELLWLQRQLAFLSTGAPTCILPASKFGNELPHLHPAAPQKTFGRIHLLEEKTQAFRSNATALSQENHQWSFFENEWKDAVHEKNRLSLQYASISHKALQYDQVKTDYDQLRETLAAVTKERDLAVKEKHQLQAKLENLEQVLKHMREAAERRQQLELEHEQALAVLNAKQKEIELLQKAQVEAKKEHEGAVQLLETTLDSMQAKVRELEEKCRTQSEQFNLLSKELERFRQQAGKIDLLSSSALASVDIPVSPSKSFSQLMNGIATSLSKGHESSSGGHCVISEYIRPLQLSGDKPEQLSIKPTFLSRSQSGSPRCRFESDMENERNSNTSKQRYSGKVHLCIARYSYNPFDGPNENPEAELPLTAGKYLYVYGDMDEDGFYEGELLDGQRGLVPSNFVDFVQDNESRLSSGLSSEQDQNYINHIGQALDGDGLLEINPPSHLESSVVNNGAGTLDVNIDEIGEDIVPYPRKITLIKQLAKSVIVGWEPPVVPPGWGTIHSYNVLVDKEIRMSVSLGSRTKALIEKLNIATCTYRISIQSITSRGNSDELQCTLLVGKDVIVAPCHLKVDNVTQVSAELTWLPTNSNYSHVIFLNEEEFDIVKAARYKYQFFNLKPNMAYKVKVLAKPHQMPWQLPLEQREKKEAFLEFSTLPAGPPAPPQDIRIQAGPTPGTILVSWKPPILTATGTSNGATVTGYGVYAKGQRVAEVIFPMAENTVVELPRIRNLDAKEVLVRTLSAQGESVDSLSAAIPPDLLVPPTPHPRPAPKSKPLPSAGIPDTKDEHLCPHVKRDESWEQPHVASPVHGHTLEPPNFHSPLQGRRSPSPNRILPQPQGTPIPNTVAKAMAREAAQRVAAESNRLERRSMFTERSNAVHYANSDEEEDGYDSPRVKRKGASVDDFLKGSELGKQPHYCHGEDYHTESSRGSDLSDIMEEDEEELYSEMQLEDGGRRRVSITSHNTLKECCKNKTTEAAFLEQTDFAQQIHHSKKLFSIPEVAEEDGDYSELLHKQGLGMPHKMRCAIARESRLARTYGQDPQHSCWHPVKQRSLEDADERGYKFSRTSTRSPDSGLDCGSEEEDSRFGFRGTYDSVSANTAPPCCADGRGCSCRKTPRPLLARRRTLTRQSSVEEDFEDPVPLFPETRSEEGRPDYYERKYEPERCSRGNNLTREDFQGGWSSPLIRASTTPLSRSSYREPQDPPLLSNPSASGRPDRVEHPGRRISHGGGGGAGQQRSRTTLVPSIDGYCSRERLSPEIYEESETDPGAEEVSTRIFVALFDYDPLTMSPNPDAAEEELPFKEGQIIKVYGDKDVDGFYRGETCARLGLIPCNMVSEIQADDEEMMEQLLRQGFLPLNTPIEKIERNRRSCRQPAAPTRRMVALYDYDPRESSPNVDVEAELTFCTGDIITVIGEIDEDGFYYGELLGQKGLVPSNFLEEVPNDVEVYLSDAPSRYAQDTPIRTKAKRVPPQNTGTSPRRAPSPTVHLHSGSPTSSVGSGSPGRGRELPSKKKKGLLSKGKKLLKRLGAVK